MKVVVVIFTLFYYVAGVPYYPSNDYNSETFCFEAQSNGWRAPGCPQIPSYYPDCDSCNSNQAQGLIQTQQQSWSSYTKICVTRKNSCLRRCQWNLQCKTQCQLQFPCNSWVPSVRSNGSNDN